MTKHSLQRALASPTRILTLGRLYRESPQTVDQLAHGLQLHPNTMREHLERLVAEELVDRETERRTVRGRPRVLYSPTSGPADPGERPRAGAERAIALGRAYRRVFGEAPVADVAVVEQLDVLEDHLDRAGFQPRVDPEALEAQLSCPFGALRHRLGRALCDVDESIIHTVLARVDGPLRLAGLVPTDASGACVLRLTCADSAHTPQRETPSLLASRARRSL